MQIHQLDLFFDKFDILAQYWGVTPLDFARNVLLATPGDCTPTAQCLLLKSDMFS